MTEPDHAPSAAAPTESPEAGFLPVPVRPRHDGWTPERQRQFVEALADTGCVSLAAARVGLSAESAYRLRRRDDAKDFDLAWDAALAHGVRRLTDLAFERAINGVATPVFYQGEIVGEKRTYSDRLLMFALRFHDPLNYGALHGPLPYDARPLDPRAPLLKLFGKLLQRLFARAPSPPPSTPSSPSPSSPPPARGRRARAA